EWTTDELVTASLGELTEKYRANSERFQEIRVVYPHPVNNAATKNFVPAAFAQRLKEKLLERNLPIPVIFETGSEATPSLENGIYICAKGSRGVPKAGSIENSLQQKFNFAIQRLARQVMVGGNVRENSLYWLIDDGITAGSTVANYWNHISGAGGSLGAVTTLSKRFIGTEILKPQEETIEFLEFAMYRNVLNHRIRQHQEFVDAIRNGKLRIEGYDLDDMPDYSEESTFPRGALNDIKRSAQASLSSLGIYLAYKNSWPKPDVRDIWGSRQPWFKETSMTNQEILLLGAYFMDPTDRESWEMLDKALRKIGSSIDQAKDTYIVKVAALEQGFPDELRELINHALHNRQLYIKDSDNGELLGDTVYATFSDTPFVNGINCYIYRPGFGR
ncbi:MAG: hypothetical protein ABL857_07225, partial [Rickettsiales bacterium]